MSNTPKPSQPRRFGELVPSENSCPTSGVEQGRLDTRGVGVYIQPGFSALWFLIKGKRVITRECPGIVIGVKDKVVSVEVVDTSVKGKGSTRVVEIATERHDLDIGQRVVVIVESTPGNRAVMFVFILPAVLFCVIFFGLKDVTDSEGLAGLLAVFTLIPYYTIFWVITSRSQGMVKMKIKE